MNIYGSSCSIFICDIIRVANIDKRLRNVPRAVFFVELLIEYFRISIYVFVAGYLSDSLLFVCKRICEQKT